MTNHEQEVGIAWELNAIGTNSNLRLPYTTVREISTKMRKELTTASNARQLINPLHEILKYFICEPKEGSKRTEYVILGRVKKGFKYFTRKDGAWFDFSLTLKESSSLTLVAYNFEIRFPDEFGIKFIRFDLNPPGHSNEERGHRAHLHPGTDDVSIPYFIMNPLELLRMMIYQFQISRKIRL